MDLFGRRLIANISQCSRIAIAARVEVVSVDSHPVCFGVIQRILTFPSPSVDTQSVHVVIANVVILLGLNALAPLVTFIHHLFVLLKHHRFRHFWQKAN